MYLEMRVDSYLKGLAETRARADAECIRLSGLIADLTTQLNKSQAERDACDRLITKLNNRIQVGQIEPIYAWQGHYGKRGSLKSTILETLRNAYPDELSTPVIALELQRNFDLVFITRAERNAWVDNSVQSSLKALMRSNLIKRTHDPTVNTGQPGTWRWIPSAGSSCDLATIAAQAGVATTHALVSEDSIALALLTEEADLEDEDDLPR